MAAIAWGVGFDGQGNYKAYNADSVRRVARSDYAFNAGDQCYNFIDPPAATLPQAASLTATNKWPVIEANPPIGLTSVFGPATGVSYFRSQVKMCDITDGASNTYLLGEKYLTPDYYEDGWDHADNESMYNGYDNDTYRTTYYDVKSGTAWTPMQDEPGFPDFNRFGSAHAYSLNLALCDGSVRAINYSIDPETHRRLGNRKDGLAVDAKRF